MSIQNILVDNNLTIKCENLEADSIFVRGTPAAKYFTLTLSVGLYYDGVFIANKTCIFQRINANDVPGVCFIHIPSFNYTTSTASNFYLQLTNGNFLISSGVENAMVANININSVVSNGQVYTDSINQRIYISPQTGNFTINANNNGLLNPVTFNYSQSFA